jgi:hypothetical protein
LIEVTVPSDLEQKSGLLYPCAATLNQNHQHNYKKDTGNDPDNRGTVHGFFLPL